ncbi:hypothetical protein FOCC_FOCC013424 [Frankliniella occidentalis]|nr:hypothetical protein FOCC_FOCC013424 [Frankliniella occidentalis]
MSRALSSNREERPSASEHSAMDQRSYRDNEENQSDEDVALSDPQKDNNTIPTDSSHSDEGTHNSGVYQECRSDKGGMGSDREADKNGDSTPQSFSSDDESQSQQSLQLDQEAMESDIEWGGDSNSSEDYSSNHESYDTDENQSHQSNEEAMESDIERSGDSNSSEGFSSNHESHDTDENQSHQSNEEDRSSQNDDQEGNCEPVGNENQQGVRIGPDDNNENEQENDAGPADNNDNQQGNDGGHADNNDDQQGNGADPAGNNGNNNMEEGNNRQRRRKTLRELIDGPYSEPINAGVDISRADLLYMALGSAKQNHFTNKAFNDSIQLINNIFPDPVLPISSARLDGILVDLTGVKYHFYCKTCLKSFGELDYKNMKTKLCENCDTVNEISDLRIATYFCMFNLSYALETLLNKPGIKDSLLKPTDAVNLGEDGHISDIYNGSVYQNFARHVSNFTELILSFHFCTDGAPLFKSSKNSIWPIMFCINELPPKLRMKNILLSGLWFGKQQPPMNLLLQPLSEHAIRLSNGFVLQINNEPVDIRAYIIGCCVDSGARGKVQGIKSHGGYYACNWCYIHGEYTVAGVKYPMREEVPRKRTNEEMKQLMRNLANLEEQLSDDERPEDEMQPQVHQEQFGVQDVSPLLNMPMFDLVSSFFVEGMHCLGLGITKTNLQRWLEEPGDFNISDFSELIDERLASLRPPLEFRRMPRKLLERARYKARELDNWLSHCIIPVLTGILPQKYLKLWHLLAQAIYLLSLRSVSYSHVNTANALLKHFIYISQQYYGEGCMVFNMHILSHLAEHVARWGPLWAASAYCFENYNGYLLKIIRSQQGVPHQVIRALSWQQSLQTLEPQVSEKARHYVKSLTKKRSTENEADDCVLLGKASVCIVSDEERWFCERLGCDISSCEEYSKLVKNNCVFSKPIRNSKKTIQ